MDAGRIGLAAVALGAGRDRVDAAVDPAAGIDVLRPVGAHVNAGEPVLRLSASHSAKIAAALDVLGGAIVIADDPPPALPLIHDTVTGVGDVVHG
jgi:pyrimidine-nucleoside phosphorylase